MRRAHYIKTHNSCEFPQQCIWFDTESFQRLKDRTIIPLETWKNLVPETDPDKYDNMEVTHHLTFGWACYMRCHRDDKWTDEDWLRFESLADFWDWCDHKTRRKTKLYLFCHNTAFDLPVLDVFGELPRRGWRLTRAVIDAPPTILHFTRDSATIVILDTLNIWRMSLGHLGKEIGLPKLAMPDNNDVFQAWDTYAKRDTEIIRTACLNWFRYLKQNDMGGFAPTLASQAMVLFRHKYMKHKIFIDTNERALKLTRSGYYGGRVECFYIGHYVGEFFALDFNAMYPAVMREESYPIKLIGHTFYATISDLRIWLKSNSVSARVLVETPEPFCPIRGKTKLIFPIGRFECILSTPEITYALDHGYIREVREVAVYDNAPIFTEMMDAGQIIKAECKRIGDTTGEFHIKKLNNSLYGKTGQSGVKWQEDDLTDDMMSKNWVELDMETGNIIHHRQLAGLHQVKQTDGESRESFPAIAAHVTAFARMKLWRAIIKAGRENVYYCDTDCIVVNRAGLIRVSDELDDYRLGALKNAGEYDDITINGNKDYYFNEKVKIKGVRNNAVWFDEFTISQEQWTGLRGLVRDGDITAPRTRKIIKHLKRVYSKGVVSASGVVLPHQLDLSTLEKACQLALDPD